MDAMQISTRGVVVHCLDGKASVAVNAIRYGMYCIGLAIVAACIGMAWLLGMLHLIALAIFFGVAMSSSYVRRETLRDFSRYIGHTASMQVTSAGITLGDDLRWAWSEILYCYPRPGAICFELLTTRRQTFHFVYSGNIRSDAQFEALKQELHHCLAQVNPGALDPD